jgi:hypothetical protein
MADLDALREALEAALRALDAPDTEESADERRRRIDRDRKRRARTNADADRGHSADKRGQNADRTRTNADTEQGFSQGIPSPPHPPRRGGGVESPADNSADKRGRGRGQTRTRTNADAPADLDDYRANRDADPADEPARAADPESWRGDFAPLTPEERERARVGLAGVREALRNRQAR